MYIISTLLNYNNHIPSKKEKWLDCNDVFVVRARQRETTDTEIVCDGLWLTAQPLLICRYQVEKQIFDEDVSRLWWICPATFKNTTKSTSQTSCCPSKYPKWSKPQSLNESKTGCWTSTSFSSYWIVCVAITKVPKGVTECFLQSLFILCFKVKVHEVQSKINQISWQQKEWDTKKVKNNVQQVDLPV